MLSNPKRSPCFLKPPAILSLLLCLVLLLGSPLPSADGVNNILSVPATAQTTDKGTSQRDKSGFSCGSLVCAEVNLDGEEILTIAGNPTIPANGITIRQRAERIQNTLKDVINAILNPDNPVTVENLTIQVATLNGQVALMLVNPPLPQIVILTVTDTDAQYHLKTKEELAGKWERQIREALLDAVSERETWPEKLPIALQVIAATVSCSLLILLGQKWLKSRWKLLKQPQDSPEPGLPPLFQTNPLINRLGQRLRIKGYSLTWEQNRKLNYALRRYLRWGQVILWLVGCATLLDLFPETRRQAIRMLELPLVVLIYWIGLGILVLLCRKGFKTWLKYWAENQMMNETASRRYTQRVPTYTVVLKSLTNILFYLGIIAGVLEYFNVPLETALTGAGLIGLGLSFGAQSLIKDALSGCLILATDQYALGDEITVGDVNGIVENLNLYITQVRSPAGELITLPNGSISVVRNLSKDWSRVDFRIEVAFSTDLAQAMQVMQQVADEMQQEPDWNPLMLEAPRLLGVETISYQGITLRMWIKTQPQQQWRVAREFRHRLKLAFDQSGIEIGVPMQFLQLENPGKQQ